MVANPDPLPHVLQYRSQRAIPVCERGDLSNVGQSVSRSKPRTPELEVKKCSLRVETHSPVGF